MDCFAAAVERVSISGARKYANLFSLRCGQHGKVEKAGKAR
jgi:hypothetical protein